MSGGGTTTTQTSGIPGVEQFLGPISQLASNYINTPYQQYPGMQVAPLSNTQQGAIQGISSMAGGTPYLNSAGNMLTGMLNSNPAQDPYTQQMIDAVTRQSKMAYNDATQGITSRFNQTGQFGGVRGQMAQDRANTDFATGLSNGIAGVENSAYQDAANRQMQALGAANGLYQTQLGGLGAALQAGGLEQQYGQNLLNSQQQNFQNYVNFPAQQLGNIGNLIGSFTGAAPHTQTTQGPGSDPFSTGLGLLIGGKYLGGSGK